MSTELVSEGSFLKLKWLFIDIGGPILDDGPLFDYLAAALRGILAAQGCQVTGDRFQETMELGWRQGASSTLDFIIRHFTSTDQDYCRAQEAYWQVFRGLSDGEYRRGLNWRRITRKAPSRNCRPAKI